MIENREILIVEDDEGISDCIREILESAGYSVHSESDGRLALDYLRSGAVSPCLILLDLMMPQMGGYQFRTEQLGDPMISGIPVVIMTADGRIEAKKEDLRADGYIRKPMGIESLLDEIRRLCP